MTSTVHLSGTSGTLHLSDCQGDLVCFQRDYEHEAGPPFCLGRPFLNWDYCVPQGSTNGDVISVSLQIERSFSELPQYTVSGFEHTPCKGGVFLRRSAVVAARGTEIEVNLSTRGVCVIVDSTDSRSGGFLTSLGLHGFVPFSTNGFGWSFSTKPLMYCAGVDHVTLPATTTSQLVHGICTL